MNDTTKAEIRKLRENSGVACIGSVNGEGYPQIKVMSSKKEIVTSKITITNNKTFKP